LVLKTIHEKNAVGSLPVYEQADPPADDFLLTVTVVKRWRLFMRIYWPKDGVLNGSWAPRGVVKMKKKIRVSKFVSLKDKE